jgi:hypothetical protein
MACASVIAAGDWRVPVEVFVLLGGPIIIYALVSLFR